MLFNDRQDAGRQLAQRLVAYRDQDPVVVALPRGGVPVAYEVARALGAPLDVIIARKLGAPGQPELGIGAIAQGGSIYLNTELIRRLGVSEDYLRRVAAEESREIERRLETYRRGRAPLDVSGRVAILIDDGLATGATMRAAIRALRAQGARAVVMAVPVCAPDTLAAIRPEVDAAICVAVPRDFRAVGLWYRDFSQTTDEEVIELLDRAERERREAARRAVESGSLGASGRRS